jgi:aminoglycoside phosphotransferase (APT) family kinase protein
MTAAAAEHADSPPGLDLPRLDRYLAAAAPHLTGPRLAARLSAGGKSNLTYVVTTGTDEYVLRRPPLGHVLATAHDMGREYRVISALADTAVPVPQTLLLCTDESVLGAPFYLMRRVAGTVYRHRAQTDELTAEAKRRLAFDMVDTLAALHSVHPENVGLADFGHPTGFLARQVRRWAGQLDLSRSRELPGIDELRTRLAATVPVSERAAIVHGDYRLDNLLVDSLTMRITAVLDWEMATLGDPLTDLGLLMTYWDALGAGELATAGNAVADGLGPAAGFPTGPELISRYAGRSPADVSGLSWYVALGCYKLAVIAEGIHYRYTQGQTVGEGFDRMGLLVLPLIEHGLAVTREV